MEIHFYLEKIKKKSFYMKKHIKQKKHTSNINKLFFFIVSLFLISSIHAEISLGYIVNSTINIGDDIQSIAVKRFLPDHSIPIDREFIHEFFHDSKVNAIISGWFMHQKGGFWEALQPPPEESWPPSLSIDPFFISIHMTGSFLPTVFSQKNIDYLKEHGPIGARDLFTFNELQKRGIPSYFSGCLTLTLENPFTERNDIIYLVDLNPELINYIKSKVSSPVVVITHGKPLLRLLSPKHRLKYAEYILDLYRKAKCVVTTRLHAAMPCLAFQTPMLMISSKTPESVDARFPGLYEHTRHCSEQEILSGEVSYNFDNPPENPTTYLPMRENLIKIMTEWVEKNSKIN
jgi:hypothetical protein